MESVIAGATLGIWRKKCNSHFKIFNSVLRVLIAYRCYLYTATNTHGGILLGAEETPKGQTKKQAWILPFPDGSCRGAAFDPPMSSQLGRTISSCVPQGKKVKFLTISTRHQRKVGRSSRILRIKGMLKLLVLLLPKNLWRFLVLVQPVFSCLKYTLHIILEGWTELTAVNILV